MPGSTFSNAPASSFSNLEKDATRQIIDVYHLENTTSKLVVQTRHRRQLARTPSPLMGNMSTSNTPFANGSHPGSLAHTPRSLSVSRLVFARDGAVDAGSALLLGRALRRLQRPDTPGDKLNKETRVKVVVRVRPPIPEDTAGTMGEFDDCTKVSPECRSILLKRNLFEDREFTFDRILDEMSSRDEMYAVVGHSIVEDVLKGYNGTILAYGQTGTGKTFTIFGPGTHWELDARKGKHNQSFSHISVDGSFHLHKMSGVIPRSIHRIFEHVEQNKHRSEFRVTVSFLQIYMENIMDLLDTTKSNLSIREDPRLGIFVENLTTVVVQEPRDILHLIKEGAQNRAVSSTNMNKISSRSHVILNITLEQRPYVNEDGGDVDDTSDGPRKEMQCVKRGTLTIVDLAGSERVSKSGSEGRRLEEAKKINKSLSALGNCVAALIDKDMTHVPFRDSKLTRLLTDSLGGNAKTGLVATIGPASWNYDESYSTLLFATRAMAVKNHAHINEVVDFKALSGNLRRKISLIEDEKYRLLARNVDLEREVAILKNELGELRRSRPTGVLNVEVDKKQLNLRWEEREKELVNKFTHVIRHLRLEIRKQNMMRRIIRSSIDGEEILERLVGSLLAIPALKKRIYRRLLPDFQQNERFARDGALERTPTTSVQDPEG